MNKGLLITFEGGDGAGKTTLIKGVRRYLLEKGESVLETRAPGGTALGEKIRSLLLHEQIPLDNKAELFLFLADRAQHVQEVIKPALLDGKVVLCDRFHDSTVAYQGARGLDSSWVRSLCLFAGEGLQPNLTFYLDIDPILALTRAYQQSGSKDRMEAEEISFHQNIRSIFHEIALQEPSRIQQMDATLSPEILLQQAIDILYVFFLSNR